MIKSLEKEKQLIIKYNYILIILYIDIMIKIMFPTCSGQKTTLEVPFLSVKASILELVKI